MQITIIYNPYLQKSIFLKNGCNLEDNSNLKEMANEKIENWFKETKNSPGFVEEIQREFGNEKIEVEFWGRACDFRDLKTHLNNCEKKHISLKEPVLIHNEIGFIEDVITFAKALEKNEKLSESLSHAFEKIYSDMFKICVIATMSSGKSTLINAMLGRDLLPSNTAACTATITTMTDNDEMETFDVRCFNKEGGVLFEKKDVTLEDLEAFNEDDSIKKIDLEGPILGVTCSNFKLHLIDTPGPNNSTNDDHEELTIEIVESDDYAMVIYVMSPTTIQSDDNDELFEIIVEEMKKKGKKAQERCLFVLNKCDELDPEDEDDTIESVIEIAKKYLIAKGIEKPNIFPVTAELAKLLRMKEMGHKITKMDRKEINSWIDSFQEYEDESRNQKLLCFEEYATLSFNSREKIEERLKLAKNHDDKTVQALIHTGIPALEEAIEEYLEKNVYPMKIMEFVEHADAYLKGNVLSSALETYFLERLTQVKRKNELLKRIEVIIDSGSDPFAGNISEIAMNAMMMDFVKTSPMEGGNKKQVFDLFAQENNIIIHMINSNGLIVVNEDYCELNPIGLNNQKLLLMKENGLKYFGSEGFGYKIFEKPEFKLDQKDVSRIIWMPKGLKMEIQYNLDRLVKKHELIDNFSQAICDETIATDAEALLLFAQKKNHPIFQ